MHPKAKVNTTNVLLACILAALVLLIIEQYAFDNYEVQIRPYQGPYGCTFTKWLLGGCRY